jgi:hypothetical protein
MKKDRALLREGAELTVQAMRDAMNRRGTIREIGTYANGANAASRGVRQGIQAVLSEPDMILAARRAKKLRKK